MFLLVGAGATLAYGLLYLALRLLLSPLWANAVALVASTVGGTQAHRGFTFGVTGRATIAPHQALGLGVLVAGLGLTSGSLWLLEQTSPDASRFAELAVLAVANGLSGVVRFVTFNLAMRPSAQRSAAHP